MADEYGFRVINLDGYVQIDSKYRNIFLLRTITVTQDQFKGSFLDVPIKKDCWYVFRPMGKDPKPYIWSFGPNRTYALRVTSPCYIYEFGFVDLSKGSGYGLQVLNEKGETVFHSDFRPLKVIGRATATLTNDQMFSQEPQQVYETFFKGIKSVGMCLSVSPQSWMYRNYAYYKAIHFACEWLDIGSGNGAKVTLHYNIAATSGAYMHLGNVRGSSGLDAAFGTKYDVLFVDCSYL
ncbi:Uncharacterised protein [Acinetobacter baumannii]|uniref:hypothetical protein n=1 Tax=Acinetobacter baumannii TaxID=470 RepID=UPI000E1AE89E|nr:hypothetical protein [Acinetobacter baumannii]MCE6085959.1 hypothetical protein [Acinetobacter baumannii]MCE6089529.1 hypothetical protein [Acinetobacter baumannii]MCE6126013.1 hypothetical protein [Acinetobacter baumannii]MCE6129702.1 hypothetical protein [Acinetobacter baumannii]MCE6139582.1 hypothetical protein [Acinetobacter baumannii]